MKVLLTLAWRNLWRKKRRTLITVSSVVFAVVLAVGLVSMIDGMLEHTIESIVRNSTGYLQIQDALYHDEPSLDHALEYGEEVKYVVEKYSNEITYTVPRIQGFSLAAKDVGSRGVMVTGIDPEKEDRMNDLTSNLIKGEMFTPGDDYAVIAAGLAHQLKVTVGDSLILLGQGFQGMTAVGKYEIGGIVEFMMPEQNNTMVYLPLRTAQEYFAAPDRLTNLILMVDDDRIVSSLADKIGNELDDEWYTVKTWEELMPDMLAAFEAREAQVTIFAGILYIVVGFGIFGTVLMMMYERLREFGILLSIGMKRVQLGTICMLETLFISFIGVIAGVVVAFPIIYRLYTHPIQIGGEVADAFMDYGFEPIFAFSISPDIFMTQAIIVFCIAVVIGLYPVRKVFTLDVVDASRK